MNFQMKTKPSMTSNTIFLDTSMFKALVDIDDDFHTKAEHEWVNIQKQSFVLSTSNFIVDESITLLRIRCGKPKAYAFRDLLSDNNYSIRIFRVTTDDEMNAWKWFVNDWSKLSFTDCVTFAQMKRLGIRDVATFDKHFKKAGFHVMSPHLR
jgi:predicted nucleic acid-binding protein